MNAIGLWAIAAQQPDRTAVIDPGGAAVTYAELAHEADRYARGLRSIGLSTPDTIATLPPNGVAALAAYFAAFQTWLYIVPVNWHQVPAEVGYILADSTAGAVIADERFAQTAVAAADLAGVKHRYGVGRVPGFEPAAALGAELSCHPAVADVAVFGIPHGDLGEEVKAVVEPVPGVAVGPGLTEELLGFLDGRLARFKRPRSIDYVAELPRDPNGKLYKRRLRDPYWAGRDRAI